MTGGCLKPRNTGNSDLWGEAQSAALTRQIWWTWAGWNSWSRCATPAETSLKISQSFHSAVSGFNIEVLKEAINDPWHVSQNEEQKTPSVDRQGLYDQGGDSGDGKFLLAILQVGMDVVAEPPGLTVDPGPANPDQGRRERCYTHAWQNLPG